MISYSKALEEANIARNKSLSGKKNGTVVVDRILYNVVYNTERQAYDLLLNGELQIQLTAFIMSKAKKDAIAWLTN
jgi:hypothetical protein